MQEIKTVTGNIPSIRLGQPLSLNQTFTGTVINRAATGELLIAAGGQRFLAVNASNIDLKAGASMLFEVRKLHPRVELHPLKVVGKSAVKSEIFDSQASLRSLVQCPEFRQSGLVQLLTMIRNPHVNFQALLTSQSLPILESLGEKILSRQALALDGNLKNAFSHSGLFFDSANVEENRQWLGANYLKELDLKFLLLKFLLMLKLKSSAFGNFRQSQALKAYSLHGTSIQRVVLPGGKALPANQFISMLDYFTTESLDQLVAHQEESRENKRCWQFDLPVEFLTELVSVPVSISERQEQAAGKPTTEKPITIWQAEFSLELSNSGKVHVKIELRDNSNVAISISTERGKTRNLLVDDKTFLFTRLADAGITLTEFDCSVVHQEQ